MRQMIGIVQVRTYLSPGAPPVDRLQRLYHEHQQRQRRRIQPLTMLGQMSFGHLQQLRTPQHVEELHRITASGTLANALLVVVNADPFSVNS